MTKGHAAVVEALRLEFLKFQAFAPPARHLARLATAAIEAQKAASLKSFKLAPQTQQLMAMQIQDAVEIKAGSAPALRENMKTARAKMGEPEARWQLHQTSPGRFLVTRIEDGARPRKDPWNTPRAVELASIPLGRSVISTTFTRQKDVTMNYKVSARKILNSETADWTVKTTSQGVRITRTK